MLFCLSILRLRITAPESKIVWICSVLVALIVDPDLGEYWWLHLVLETVRKLEPHSYQWKVPYDPLVVEALVDPE